MLRLSSHSFFPSLVRLPPFKLFTLLTPAFCGRKGQTQLERSPVLVEALPLRSSVRVSENDKK